MLFWTKSLGIIKYRYSWSSRRTSSNPCRRTKKRRYFLHMIRFSSAARQRIFTDNRWYYTVLDFQAMFSEVHGAARFDGPFSRRINIATLIHQMGWRQYSSCQVINKWNRKDLMLQDVDKLVGTHVCSFQDKMGTQPSCQKQATVHHVEHHWNVDCMGFCCQNSNQTKLATSCDRFCTQ